MMQTEASLNATQIQALHLFGTALQREYRQKKTKSKKMSYVGEMQLIKKV